VTSALFADESRKCASLEASGEVGTEALVARGHFFFFFFFFFFIIEKENDSSTLLIR
jgi:hypothetical protein